MSVLVESARNRFLYPSFELGAGAVEVRRNLFPNPAVTSTAGFSALAAQADLSFTGSAVRWEALTNSWTEMRLDGSGVATGVPARLLVRARASKALTARMRIRSGAEVNVPLTTDWQWFETVGTAGAGAAVLTGLYFPTPHNHTAGDWLEIDRVLLAVGSDTGPWFSGEGPSDPDMPASWTGAPNASPSVLTVTPVQGVTGPDVVQSSLWAVEGSKSLRMLGGWTMATLTDQTAVVYARNPEQFASIGDKVEVARDGVVRIHGTGSLLLSAGWWDVLTIVDGEYAGPPFSGDTPPVQGRKFSWAGEPHKSEAIQWEWEKASITPHPDMDPVPRVNLDIPVSIFPAGAVTVSITRTAEGRTFDVRGGQRLSTAAPAVVIDTEAPFGVESSYTAIGYDADGKQVGTWPLGTVTLHYDRPVIQQPLDPRLSVEVRRLATTAERITRPTPSELVYPQGRVLPGMVGLGPRRGVEAMALDLFVATHADGDLLQATLGTYETPQLPIWLVRTPPPQRIPRVFFCHVPEVGEIDINGRIGMEYLQYSATVTEVHPPAAGVVAVTLRYTDVATVYSTYSAVGARYATYSDLKRDESLIGASDA